MPQHEFRPAITSLASGLFCWLGDVLFYPIDTISTRLKGNKQKLKVSTARFIWQSLKKEGTTLYRGVTLTFPHSFIPTALYIYVYQNLMRSTSRLVDSLTTHKQIKLVFPFFISSIAEALTLIIELPFDTVRTRMQMNSPEYQYSSALEGLRQIYQREGLLRFYKSTRIYFVTKTFYTAVQFQTYELLTYYFHWKYAMFFNSIVSAIVATTVVNPLEVIITRYALVDTTKKKLVFSYMVKRLWQHEGFTGFYKGYVTEVTLHSLYAALWMPVFQFMRDRYGVNLGD